MGKTYIGPSKCKRGAGTLGELSAHTTKGYASKTLAKPKRGASLKTWNSDSGRKEFLNQAKHLKKSNTCCPTCGQKIIEPIHLSIREKQVVELVGGQGMTYPEAARQLGLASSSVASYAKLIRDRVGGGKPRVVLALVAHQQKS